MRIKVLIKNLVMIVSIDAVVMTGKTFGKGQTPLKRDAKDQFRGGDYSSK